MVLLGGLSNFDRKELLAPAMLTSMFAAADSARHRIEGGA